MSLMQKEYTYKIIADKITNDRNIWENIKRFFIKPKVPTVKEDMSVIKCSEISNTEKEYYTISGKEYYTIYKENEK